MSVIDDWLQRLGSYLPGQRLRPALREEEPPLKAELLSAEQMERHGRALAGMHRLGSVRTADRLLPRLAENEKVLHGVRNLLGDAVRANRRLTPAGEWLLDNFYLIQEQIRTARRHLPKGYSRELPRLQDGPSAGFPRVYDIALEAVSHGDGRADPESLSRFVGAYQQQSPLLLGELWAIPIMLRLALIENLRRIATRIATDRIDRNLADYWAEQMTKSAADDPKSLILVIADMARSSPPLVSSFVAELACRLQGRGSALALPLNWIEQRLSEEGSSINQLVEAESQKQAADQVSIGNSVGSLRLLGAMDWREFVEALSVVDRILRQDPVGAYGRMDFLTRDRYRHRVEEIAKWGALSEGEVAELALRQAKERAAASGADERDAHVGFCLIGRGAERLERAAEVRWPPGERLRRWARRRPGVPYAGAIALLMLAIVWTLLGPASAAGGGEAARWLLALLLVVCSSQLAIPLVNGIATVLVRPEALPRMDYSRGIPPEHATLVVIPAMLTGLPEICGLIEALEVRFLANRGSHLHFALLTDFCDSPLENEEGDESLLAAASDGIERLNVKYASEKSGGFFLLHRPRRWNPRDRIWMGYERKRGKLADLNRLLRGGPYDAGGAPFSRLVGDVARLRQVRYVITLDSDTQLPRDAACQFVGAMTHPLNRAVYDPGSGRVVDGYGILQPRVAISLGSMNRSRYAAMWGGEPGIDPYTRAVSDVYQDLFGEGSFIGKGIYDVDIFETALGGRLPENRILSHDLLEGCYARSGLLSDLQLIEEYPARYLPDVKRRHRWVRGDWQILRWATARVPDARMRLEKNPLSALSRWKIFDNLRRSLVPAALVLLLLAGWNLLSSPLFWTAAVVAIIALPPLVGLALELLRWPRDTDPRRHLAHLLGAAGRRFAQAGFALACLPHEACYCLDAVVRTLWRTLVSGRGLLEWNPSGGADPGQDGPLAHFRVMWIGPAIAVAQSAALLLTRPEALAAAAPILALWFASPAIADWVGRPQAREEARLGEGQRRFLRRVARMTWSYFETFVGPADHWLPPDNFQETPVPTVAHRTSPTNIGLALLANLSAYDFGYITGGQLLDRTRQTFATMARLERHQGHFFNWYDTRSLLPLLPLYVSSVDSGNLAGHLLTLRPGLLALPEREILGPRLFAGIEDTLIVLSETLKASPGVTRPVQLSEFRELLGRAVDSPPAGAAAFRAVLERLAATAAELARELGGPAAEPDSPLAGWAESLAAQCRAALDELTGLVPWSAWGGQEADPDPGRWPEGIPTLRELAGITERIAWPADGGEAADPRLSGRGSGRAGRSGQLAEAARRARGRISLIEDLARQCGEFAAIGYDFLYDRERSLLSIGFHVGERKPDQGYYDLLASEARFSTFVAIAQGSLPQRSWFALGRLLTTAGGEPVLLSWSGSMFEYLMPLLVMPSYEHTLLDQTAKAAVARQIDYGRLQGVPWGISESGYNSIDVQQNYQYRAFGVPGLGFKRGLADDLVVAPYASAMALIVAPEEACRNLERLEQDGFAGRHGFYEAIDYTPARLQRGQPQAVVRSFMSHHQGMSLLALASLLLDSPMQRRFASEPLFQSTLLLLQERVPRARAHYSDATELSEQQAETGPQETPIRLFHTPNTPLPEVQLLSNGRYHVMLTNGGGGYSRWQGLAVTRWQEDGTCDPWGTFAFIRDAESGHFWSTSAHPVPRPPESFEAVFSEGRVEFRCSEDGIGSHTEIAVSPEDDIELRRITLTNRSGRRRTIEITSYAEVVLAPEAADSLHPAFSNLFVETEILERERAILCKRRPRSAGERTPFLLHQLVAHGVECGDHSFETDRMRFIGRGNGIGAARALTDPGNLSGGAGAVLDPIVAIRCRFVLDPDGKATVSIVTGVAATRDAAIGLVGKYQDRRISDRVFDLAWTHSHVLLQQINASEADAQLYNHLAGSVIHANATLRAEPEVIQKNRRGQSGLWGHAISGDLPIVLLSIGDQANIELVRQLVQAHAYWRLKGLMVDLVIWNEDRGGYRQLLHDRIVGLISAGVVTGSDGRQGAIFVRPADQISAEDRILIMTVARVILSDRMGSLADQLRGRKPVEIAVPRLIPVRTRRFVPMPQPAEPRHDLIFFNGLGGFTRDGREYVISTAHGQLTPAPWINVLANAGFGTIVSESGSSYTWAENAHEFRLTPWHNDPVRDRSGESLYLRDEERGNYWSPLPLPVRGLTPYVARHGFGYSVFEHTEHGIRSEAWIFVALDSPVKLTILKVRNLCGRPRRLSATGIVEWVLGDLRPKTLQHVRTEIDPTSGAILARNPYNTEFPDRCAFFNADGGSRSHSGDRNEFLGRNGTSGNPAAMGKARLSGRVGAALDPCGAIQLSFGLDDGQELELLFTLGAEKSDAAARGLAVRYRSLDAAKEALDEVWRYWTRTTGAIQVQTPDPALDVMANGWLLYQTIACRLWGRSGFYQSGGAYGFRDQLQDAMAVLHAEPTLARKQLLRSAARQFSEGDVQHWWHPPAGRGVRTHCSDDYLWLPLAVCRYVAATADTGVLDEQVPFLQGRPVKPEEDSYYDLPARTEQTGSLYDHCVLAVRRGLRFGARGLPLIGTGDWNDGMNLVGAEGRGESVWLAFFLYHVLERFAALARGRGDDAFASRCLLEAETLRRNIEANGWDGGWYRRAFFDDGTPLGSATSSECQIDSVSQSWSVISGAGDPERSRQAMAAVAKRLVRADCGVIQLLDPPFDRSEMDPGYIKGYLPGVRENGGQYTHGAIWTVMAFAMLGEQGRAWELLAMINPVNHASSPEGVETYRVEPYVVAADVYAVAPHAGRGGWTWYTGSAGWLYRLIVETLLGLRLAGEALELSPSLPEGWAGFSARYRWRQTLYRIEVVRASDGDPGSGVTLDGEPQRGQRIPLLDDRREHRVEIRV